jgi:hypothetical protein
MGFGFRPTEKAGAGYNTGGFVEVPINADNVAVNIYNGECVTYTTAKGIDRLTNPVANASTTAGVLVGARWETATGEQKWGQFYDGAAGNTEMYAFVAPARDTIFRVQGNASYAAAQLGVDYDTTGTSGSTSTGNSDLQFTNGTVGTQPPCTLVGVLEDGSNENSTTPVLLVRFVDGAIQDILA